MNESAMLVALFSVLGAALSSVLACLPGLHVYNVMGLLAMAAYGLDGAASGLPKEATAALAAGMIVGYALLNTVPSVLFAAPDESALFTVLPGQSYVMQGRGYDAIMIATVGGAGGLAILLAVFAPLAPVAMPVAHNVLRPHAHWILWCVIAYMLLSEWPKGGTSGPAGWRRFLDAWRSTGAGLLTFLLSGLLGFLLLYGSPTSPDVAFQSLMPGFVGLFTVPWMIVNLLSRVEIPPQHVPRRRADRSAAPAREAAAPPASPNRSPGPASPLGVAVLKGVLAGSLGGGFAAFFPAITGGVGGLLAGQATAARDHRTFLASQGASKLVYYVGALLLFFVPDLHLKRGGAAWMVQGFFVPEGFRDYYLALAAVALAGATALLLAGPLAGAAARFLNRHSYRAVSASALALVVAVVLAVTGWMGILVMTVAAAIGLIPVLFGSRRMNCLGVILLPIACNLSGFGPALASRLGLL